MRAIQIMFQVIWTLIRRDVTGSWISQICLEKGCNKKCQTPANRTTSFSQQPPVKYHKLHFNQNSYLNVILQLNENYNYILKIYI